MRLGSVALVLLLGSVSACAAPPSPDPVPTPPASPTAAPTGAGAHPFPDLEARLPTRVGGRLLDTSSFRADPSLQDVKTLRMLEILGKSAADLQLANAGVEGVDVTVGALRVVGSDAVQMVAVLRQVDEEDPGHTAVYGEATVSGHAVVTRTVTDRTEYIYPLEDIMFVVQGSPELVNEAIGQLPFD